MTPLTQQLEDKKKYPKLHNFNEMYTPDYALDYIERFLPKGLIYWESCYGKGHLAKALEKRGFKVIGNKDIDCLKESPDENNWDVWITNPPWKTNKDFIKRAIDLKKPFAFLIRLEHLGGVKAMELFKDLDIQIIIPRDRIHYITPKILRGEKTGGSQFHSIWLTYGFNLPRQINYISKDNGK
jgi:hypothetical protein